MRLAEALFYVVLVFVGWVQEPTLRLLTCKTKNGETFCVIKFGGWIVVSQKNRL